MVMIYVSEVENTYFREMIPFPFAKYSHGICIKGIHQQKENHVLGVKEEI